MDGVWSQEGRRGSAYFTRLSVAGSCGKPSVRQIRCDRQSRSDRSSFPASAQTSPPTQPHVCARKNRRPAMNPIVFALRHPITTLMLVVALVGGGALATYRMRVDVFP